MASIRTVHTKHGERRYIVKYRDPSGKSREKWHRRKVDAEKFSRTVEVDKDRGDYIDPNAGRIPFSEVADRWLAGRSDKAPATQKQDRSYLQSMILPTFGDRPIKSILPSEIETWLANLDRAPNARGKALQKLRSILALAHRDRLITHNPAADVTPPPAVPVREGIALNDDQVRLLIEAAEEVDERTAVAIHLMVRAGLRIGEALALRRRDVDLDNPTINVATSMPREGDVRPVKGRHSEAEGRIVPIPDDVVQRLRRHLAERHVAGINDLVVTAPRGGPLRYPIWRSRIWVRIVERLDFEVLPHDLRKTSTTRLFREDRWTPGEVQEYLGHKDPRTTLKIYDKVNSSDLPQPSTLNTRSR
jgi:integrase